MKKIITFSMCLFSAGVFADQAVKPFNGKNLDGWKQKAPTTRSHLTVGTAKLDPKNPRAFTVAKGGNELINAKGRGVDFYSEAVLGMRLLRWR